MSAAREPADGLQPERTRLSWSRTALSLGAVGALVSHVADTRLSFGGGLVLILLALTMYVVGVARYRQLHRAVPAAGPVASPAALRLVGTCVALAAPAALLVLFG